MALTFFKWSRTAADNASADASVNWREGQAPSTVNDSARSMMASTAAYRDDTSGATTTAGTSTAYTLTTYQVFDTLAHLSGNKIGFTPHTANGGTVTLNVDGLGAKPLRSSPGVELPAGALVQGTPYVAVYNNSDAAFYLQGYFDPKSTQAEAEAGTVNTTLLTPLRGRQLVSAQAQFYTPEQFGAGAVEIGTGTVDHTAALLDCVETAFQEGKAVRFKPGRYNISEGVELRNPGTFTGPNGIGWPGPQWIGVPQNTEIYARDGMTGPMFKMLGVPETFTGGSYVYGGGMSGIILNGTSGGASCDGISLIGWNGPRFDNCMITRMPRYGATATVDLMFGPFPYTVDITGATKTNPVVVSYDFPNDLSVAVFQNGISIAISGVGGMTQLNGNTYTVANIDADAQTFELSGVNGTSYGVYTSGGTISRTDAGNPANGDYSLSQSGQFFNTFFLRNGSWGWIDLEDFASSGFTFEECSFTLNWDGGVFTRSTNQEYRNCAIAYNGFDGISAQNATAVGMEVGLIGGSPVQGLLLDKIEFDANSNTNLVMTNATHSKATFLRHLKQAPQAGQYGPTAQFMLLGKAASSRCEGFHIERQYWRVGGTDPFTCVSMSSDATVRDVQMPYIERAVTEGATVANFGGPFTASGRNRRDNYFARMYTGEIIMDGRPRDCAVGEMASDVSLSTLDTALSFTLDAVNSFIFSTTLYSGSTFTVLVDDWYKIRAVLRGLDIPGTTIFFATIAAGGVPYVFEKLGLGTGGRYTSLVAEEVKYLTAGQTVIIYASVSTGSPVLKGTVQPSTLSIESLS